MSHVHTLVQLCADRYIIQTQHYTFYFMTSSFMSFNTILQVDGFRFDIMGHMLLRTLNKMRAALDGLTPEEHGVDGK